MESGSRDVKPEHVPTRDYSTTGIKNFHQVKPWLFRGAQPDLPSLRKLADLGIKTVISLRWLKRHIVTEATEVKAAGMTFISIPLTYWSAPDRQAVESFLSILEDRSNRPIFVHCLHGSDRSGLMLALYRIEKDGWSVEDAYAEMKRCGFHKIRVRHFKWVLFHYARKHQMQQSL